MQQGSWGTRTRDDYQERGLKGPPWAAGLGWSSQVWICRRELAGTKTALLLLLDCSVWSTPRFSFGYSFWLQGSRKQGQSVLCFPSPRHWTEGCRLVNCYAISLSKAVNKRPHMHSEAGYEKNLDWITQASCGDRVGEVGEREKPGCPSRKYCHSLETIKAWLPQVSVWTFSQQSGHSPWDSSESKLFPMVTYFPTDFRWQSSCPAHCAW